MSILISEALSLIPFVLMLACLVALGIRFRPRTWDKRVRRIDHPDRIQLRRID